MNESEPSYLDYIIRGKNSIVKRWLRAGADGWRLDVADELPDAFIHDLHTAARSVKPDAVVIGEVWEDGSNKIAYGVRRRHILGGHCDGLMNYPFRSAAISYLLGGDALWFREAMESLRANYPPFAYHSAMNALGTHDTPRILTLLGVGSDCKDRSRTWRAEFRLSPEEYARGKARLKLGALLLYAFPGSPTLYYGDEAGMQGFEDPFNRRTYPWGEEDRELRDWFTALGCIRGWSKALRRGSIVYERAEGSVLAFRRTWEGESVLAAANAGGTEAALPIRGPMKDLMTGEIFPAPGARRMEVSLPPCTGRLLVPLRYRH